MLIRAVAGFALALGLLHWQAVQTSLQSPDVMAVKADLAAARPGAKLLASVDAALRALQQSRNGTGAAYRTPHASL